MIVRHTYRLRPGRRALAGLWREWDGARWVWNKCVEHKKTGKDRFDYKDLTQARSQMVGDDGVRWLAEGSCVVQQQAIRDFRLSKGRACRFKSRRVARPSMNYTKRGFSLVMADGRKRLRLAGGLTIPVVWSRDLPCEPSSVRIYQDSLGHWYASFVVRVDLNPLPPTGQDKTIGIDWGIKTLATTTDPDYDLPHPHHGDKAARRLARYQRRMARRRPAPGKPSSNGYKKAKHHTAKMHKKIARQRLHTARTWAKDLISDHDTIVIEDIQPSFMAPTPLAKKAADAAITTTKNILLDTAARAGRKVVTIPPAYTRQTCSKCLARTKQPLPLTQRTFRCHTCGHTADRDQNAAHTILKMAGLNHVVLKQPDADTPTKTGGTRARRATNPPASAVGSSQPCDGCGHQVVVVNHGADRRPAWSSPRAHLPSA